MSTSPPRDAPTTPATAPSGTNDVDPLPVAAGLTRGPAELLDFLVPLWAGAVLSLDARAVGLLLACELAVSVAVRPLAGRLCDRLRRSRVAAVGATGYALSCVLYTVADTTGPTAAFGAAALGGIGGSLLWVAVRSLVGVRHLRDPKAFAALMSAEETGVWVAFIGGLSLLGTIDYRGVFLACGASCAVAAAALLLLDDPVPARTPPDARRPLPGALRPWLVVIVVTTFAETAVGLLLLFHLQRAFGLEVVESALVFLPGAIALSVLPPYLHRVVQTTGRATALTGASVAAAVLACGLAWAPSPWVLGALWLFSAAAWATAIPIEQAAVSEIGRDRIGFAMGVYESWGLVGATLGAVTAGVLYASGPWRVACLALAAVTLTGAALGPWAVRRSGLRGPGRPPVAN